jgi:hypothetical protein
MTDLDYINKNIILQWLQHFQKHRSPGKSLLILDRHPSHSTLKCLDHCRNNGSEMLCLPPHTTLVLPPLVSGANLQHTLCTIIPMLQSPNFIFENFPQKLGRHFPKFPDDTFLPYEYSKQELTSSLSSDTFYRFLISTPETPNLQYLYL